MKRSDIRTKLQGDTPFFPNMLNNSKVEVCLKEDVDKYCDELENNLKIIKIELDFFKSQVEKIKELRKNDIQILMKTSSERQDIIIDLKRKIKNLKAQLRKRDGKTQEESTGA